MQNESGYKEAYEKLLKENTKLNAENGLLKGQIQEAVKKFESNVNQLDGANKKLELGIVQALRKAGLNDSAIIEWINENKIPLALRIVPDNEDQFKG